MSGSGAGTTRTRRDTATIESFAEEAGRIERGAVAHRFAEGARPTPCLRMSGSESREDLLEILARGRHRGGPWKETGSARTSLAPFPSDGRRLGASEQARPGARSDKTELARGLLHELDQVLLVGVGQRHQSKRGNPHRAVVKVCRFVESKR